jgi:hypothetical protein
MFKYPMFKRSLFKKKVRKYNKLCLKFLDGNLMKFLN